MKIGSRCEKCGNIYMQHEDDCTILFDYKEKHISFMCPSCHHDNIMDWAGWEEQSKKSPLPRIGISR